MSRLIHGLAEIADEYNHFILDIFGVLHDGLRPFTHTLDTLHHLKQGGKQICLLSNSPRRAHNAADQLKYMGITSDLYDHIVTSGESTHQALINPEDDFHRQCGRACWAIGHSIAHEILHGISGLKLLNGPEHASFILNAIPGTSPTEVRALKAKLSQAVDMDLPMICANPDLVVHIGENLHECAGTFASVYEEMGGRVVYHGKPHKAVYDRAHSLLGSPDKSRILAVGDSIHTDITGARNFGIHSVLNLGGIHREEFMPENLYGLEQYSAQPDFLITQFKC
jgi:HAD superfamily hydrolase (TIGR01459 family)